jgi:hypothetical protein
MSEPAHDRKSRLRPAVAGAFNERRALLGLFGVSALLLSACSSVVRREPERAGGVPLSGEVSEDRAREVAFLALSLVDTPYRYGGNTPKGGFDCSGLIVYAYRTGAQRPLPRTVARLAKVGRPISAGDVRAGDLVFFDAPRRFSHAGIYVGDGRFVHAPSRGGRVRLDSAFTGYWRPRLAAIRRV